MEFYSNLKAGWCTFSSPCNKYLINRAFSFNKEKHRTNLNMHWSKPKQCHKCKMNNKHKDWRTVIEFTIFFLISCLMNWSPIEIKKVSCCQNTVKVSKWPDIIFISRLLYMYVPGMYLQCMVTLAKSSLNFLFDRLVVHHYTAGYWASPSQP